MVILYARQIKETKLSRYSIHSHITKTATSFIKEMYCI